jgi:diguanylate cyclase (GGDEF)-like protein
VLLVEDNPADARLVEILLDETEPEGFEVTRCGRLGEALELLERGEPGFEVVLLDLSLPDSAGMETISRARACALGTPIVVMSGRDDEEIALRALQSGAEDYLIKGRGDGEVVARAIRYAIERARTEARLNYLARFDPLTGLANRALLEDRLEGALSRGDLAGSKVALAVLDLYRFKAVNDSLGHAVGDELLVTVARRIEGRVREGDTVARVGADEFAVLLEDLKDEGEIIPIVRRVQDALSEPFVLGGREIFVTTGVGVAVSPPSQKGGMLRDAEAALRRVRRRRAPNGYEFYVPEMNARASERMALEADLRRAIRNPDEEFEIHYQPQVDLRTGRIVGAEALLRWRRPGTPGLVPPGEFIPVLEEMGGIFVAGEWVMRQACALARAWREAGRPIRVAVNVSAPQFVPGLVKIVSHVLREANPGPEPLQLELEITESLLVENPEASTRVLEKLKAVGGVRVAIDDFGTGYSSLDRLATFPIDLLKVDRSFVRDVKTVPKRAAIAAVIVELAHRLDLQVMAEGVETAEQADFLLGEGCDLAQGFLFSRPLPADEFAGLLNRGEPLRAPDSR